MKILDEVGWNILEMEFTKKKIFKNDLLEGEYIDYYSFGQILSKRYYVKNKLEGIYKSFIKMDNFT